MKKIILLLIGASLYANGLAIPELDIHSCEVLHLINNQLISTDGLVLELKERNYVELFDEGDSIQVKESNGDYSVIHNLTNIEVPCGLAGIVEGKVHFVGKVMDGMVELSNGELFVTEVDIEGFWTVRTSVLKVVTPNGEILIDLSSGDSQQVVSLGTLDIFRELDFITSSKGHHVELVKTGPVRWISSDLGSCLYWDEGDEVIVQKFVKSNIKTIDLYTPLVFLHNVTRDEFAIAISVTE